MAQGQLQNTTRRFTISDVRNGRLPATMKLTRWCEGTGMNHRYAQRLAKEGKLPCTMFEGRWYIDTAAGLKALGLGE